VKRNYSCQQQPWVDNIVSISNIDNLTCISQKTIRQPFSYQCHQEFERIAFQDKHTLTLVPSNRPMCSIIVSASAIIWQGWL
jgi:hypothetical protein